jgi:hypothetical protein
MDQRMEAKRMAAMTAMPAVLASCGDRPSAARP